MVAHRPSCPVFPVIVMDDLLRDFLAETGEHLDIVDAELVRFEREPADTAVLRNIFRLVHTVKGTCGFLGLVRLEALAHAAEALMGRLRDGKPVTSDAVGAILSAIDRLKIIIRELERVGTEPDGSDDDVISGLEAACEGSGSEYQVLLRPLRPGEVPLDELERAFRRAPANRSTEENAAPPPGPDATPINSHQTVRVGVDVLEHLMTTVSELVLTRNQLVDIARKTSAGASLDIPLRRLSAVTAELQDGIMRARMQPIAIAWAKLPRIVRDLGRDLGKRLNLALAGGETELDRQVLDLVRDPLTHIVRNAADHGIEPAEIRKTAGKPEIATIRLHAFQEGGTITIEIADDGAGLDLPSIRTQAVATGIVAEAEAIRLSDDQVAQLIFQPGFTTSRCVTAISGRGVGLDVVKTNIGLIGGSVTVSSQPGCGTTFRINLPLTLAILAAVIVGAAKQRFALPQAAVVELLRVRPGSPHAIERINGAAILRHRGGLVPVVELGRLLDPVCGEAVDDGYVAVAQIGRRLLGIMVDSVLETEEIVVKPMCSLLRGAELFTGHTVLGDGSVVLILDPGGIARRLAPGNLQETSEPPRAAGRMDDTVELLTFLVFRGGDRTLKALPLSVVSRLEEVDAGRIETGSGRNTVQYRGRILPLFPVDEATRVAPQGTQPLVVVSEGARTVGLIVSEIVDVIESALDISPVPDRPDLVGSAILRGRTAEIVDIGSFLARAGADSAVAEQPSPRRSVLLVDPNPFFRDMLNPVLRAAGYRVRNAADGADIGAATGAGTFDAVVADLGSADVVEALRRGPAVPVIALDPSGAGAECPAFGLDIVGAVSKFDRSGLLSALALAAEPRELAA